MGQTQLLAGGAFYTLVLAHLLQTVWDFVVCCTAVEHSSNSLKSLTGAANFLVSAALAILADSTKTFRTHCNHDYAF